MAGVFYNTNGFAHHRLEDALRILADAGYDGVALTPDVHHLDPLHATSAEVARVATLCARLGLSVLIETGARFVLDPTRKHRPNLLDGPEGAARRLDFLTRCVDLGADLGAKVVSVWSGALPEGVTPTEGWQRLARGLSLLCEHVAPRGMLVGFEPEPGMLVERADRGPGCRSGCAIPRSSSRSTSGTAWPRGKDNPTCGSVDTPPIFACCKSTTTGRASTTI